MAKPKRVKLEGRPGVYFREVPRLGGPGIEKSYVVVFKRDGKVIEAVAGRQYRDKMTPARAAQYRSALIEGRQKTPQEKREAERKAQTSELARWTIDKLWTEYEAGRRPGKALDVDRGRYERYIKPLFADLEPHEIVPLDVERLKRRLLKNLSPQTTKHVLNLLTWIVNFGVKKSLCSGLTFHLDKPTVNNEKTEDLDPDQLQRLLAAIQKDEHPIAGNMMLMALYSGLRRGEMFKLKWAHIDFVRGFINLVDPKGGPDQTVPLNEPTSELLEGIHRTRSPYVFPGQRGGRRTTIAAAVNEIKKAAGLPVDFRPLHGLRHVYASMLASSGQVDMYVLQRLLTHKDPKMTQRYAHLRDEALRNASNLVGDIVTGISAKKGKAANEK